MDAELVELLEKFTPEETDLDDLADQEVSKAAHDEVLALLSKTEEEYGDSLTDDLRFNYGKLALGCLAKDSELNADGDDGSDETGGDDGGEGAPDGLDKLSKTVEGVESTLDKLESDLDETFDQIADRFDQLEKVRGSRKSLKSGDTDDGEGDEEQVSKDKKRWPSFYTGN